MSTKNTTEVLIAGKIFTLSGYESEEYLQRVASYINHKIAEFGKMESYKRLPKEMKGVLLDLNIADDYFKAKKQVEVVEEEIEGKHKELYDIKHELIAAQIELENSEKELDKVKKENSELQKRMIELETELKESEKRSKH